MSLHQVSRLFCLRGNPKPDDFHFSIFFQKVCIIKRLGNVLPSRYLESGIDVASCINVASGKFDRKNKYCPLKHANLCSNI